MTNEELEQSVDEVYKGTKEVMDAFSNLLLVLRVHGKLSNLDIDFISGKMDKTEYIAKYKEQLKNQNNIGKLFEEMLYAVGESNTNKENKDE